MNVSFTGNFLYIFRNQKIRDDVMNKFEEQKDRLKFVAEPVDNNKMLLLNG